MSHSTFRMFSLFNTYTLIASLISTTTIKTTRITCTASANNKPVPNTTESESSSNGGGLRSHRDIGANWEGGARVQRVGHRATSLVGYAGQPATTHCAVAHAKGSRRWRKEGLSMWRR